MIDEQIHVAIPSYKRAGRVRTLKTVPFGWVWVPQSQADDYRKHYGDRVITIPDELDGNVSKKRNAILNFSPCPWTLILDDDVSRIGMLEGSEKFSLGPDHIREMIEHYFILADQLGVKLWGIAQNQDSLNYRTNIPFNFLHPILGPFNGHLEPELRYDEDRFDNKEDYDFWLQNIERHRRTLRVNKYHYIHDHGQMKGGFNSMRTMENEKRNARVLMEKWGSEIIKVGSNKGPRGRTGTNILNNRIRIPIPGC